MTGFHTDITERKQTEIALRASEEKYRNLVAHLNAGFIVYDTDLKVVQCNSIAGDILGINKEDLLGQVATPSLWQLLREDGTALPVAEHPVNLVLQQGREIEKYVLGIQKSGHAPLWLLLTAFPEFDEKGSLQRIVMTFIDISSLKRAEQASAQLAAIVASSEDAIIGKTLTGIITSWNTGATKIFGYTAEEMIGQPITKLIPPERLDEEVRILDCVRQGKSLDSYDTQRCCKDGKRVDVSITVSPIKDRQGNLIGISKIARNISDRKQAELALRESEARFQAFMQNAPLLVWIVDAAEILIYGNSAFLALLNCNLDTAIGQPITTLFSTELSEEYQRNNQLVRETNSILETVETIPDPSGTQHQYLVRKFPLHHQDQTAWVGSVAFDITERQQAAEAIRKSEERFRQIAETIQDVFFIHSPDFQQLDYVSPAYESIWGRSRASLYQNPHSWLEAIHPDDRQTVQDALKQQLTGVPFQGEYRIIRPDGSIRWIFSRTFPTFQPTGELQHYIGLASDITERKQAEMTQKALIEAIPDFLVRMRRDGLQLELLNRGAIHLLQANTEAISGSSVTEIMPPEIAQERLILTERALATGKVQTQEYQFDLDGMTVYEEARIAPLGTDEVLVVVRDITDRHRSEEALRASEEKFRQLAENIHQVFFILSVSGEILYVSPAYEQIWQRSSAPLYQNLDDWLESIHPDDRARVTAAFYDHIRLQQPCEEIYRIYRPNGEIRWISVQSFPLLDASGNVTRFTGIAEDITQQKQAEAALRQSEATKQAIIEAIPDLLMRMRRDGTELEFISNTDFNVIPDLSQLGPTISLSDVLDPELAQRRLAYAQRALETGQTQIYEHQICINNQRHYEEIRIVPLPQDAVLVMIRNITDRKQAEIDLLREKERFQAIVDHIPIMVTIFNAQGRVEFVNPALERILGWSLADWQTRDLLPACYPDPVYRQSALDHMLAATGQWRDLPIRTASGQQLETSWANVRLSDGRFLGIGQDITDRKQKELALQQAMEAAESANMAKSRSVE